MIPVVAASYVVLNLVFLASALKISACPGLLFPPCVRLPLFLGVFAELTKSTVSFIMSVRVEQLGSHWTDFNEI